MFLKTRVLKHGGIIAWKGTLWKEHLWGRKIKPSHVYGTLQPGFWAEKEMWIQSRAEWPGLDPLLHNLWTGSLASVLRDPGSSLICHRSWAGSPSLMSIPLLFRCSFPCNSFYLYWLKRPEPGYTMTVRDANFKQDLEWIFFLQH